MFLAIEAGLTVLTLVLAFAVPNLGSRWFEAIERNFGKLAQRRGLSVLVVGLTALVLRAALLPILSAPHSFGQVTSRDQFRIGTTRDHERAIVHHQVDSDSDYAICETP